jgi:hypothetical protein
VEHPQDFDTLLDLAIEDKMSFEASDPPLPDIGQSGMAKLPAAAHSRHLGEFVKRLPRSLKEAFRNGKAILSQVVKLVVEIAIGLRIDEDAWIHSPLAFS